LKRRRANKDNRQVIKIIFEYFEFIEEQWAEYRKAKPK